MGQIRERVIVIEYVQYCRLTRGSNEDRDDVCVCTCVGGGYHRSSLRGHSRGLQISGMDDTTGSPGNLKGVGLRRGYRELGLSL